MAYTACHSNTPAPLFSPPCPPHPTLSSPVNRTPGHGRVLGFSSARVGVGLGAPLLGRCLPDTPHPTLATPSAVCSCPRSPVASVQWESRWVIGSRLKILIIHEAGKGLGGVAAGVGVGWGGDESGRAGEQFWEG